MKDSGVSAWVKPVIAVLTLIALVTCIVLSLDRDGASASTADAQGFSSKDAIDMARMALGQEQPHPVGSAANADVRQRIAQQLRNMGYLIDESALPSCRFSQHVATCAIVHDIVARLPRDDGSRKAVAVTAHYDSVSAGPGVADDLSNVGILLELAKLHAENHWPHAPLAVVFTDGEEPGLLGAQSLVNQGWGPQHISYMLNLEARGTTGRSIMFEAGPGSGHIVNAYLQNARFITGGSYVLSMYHLLPNDTDYSVFKSMGLPGLNFAFAEGWERYHSPRDDFAHLDASSVQEQGDAVLRTLSAMDSTAFVDVGPAPDFLDICHLGVLKWDSVWTWPLVLVGVALLAIGLVGLARKHEAGFRTLLMCVFKPAAAMVTVVVAMLLILEAWHFLAGVPDPWLAHPWWSAVAPIAVCVAAVVVFWRSLPKYSNPSIFSGQVIFSTLLLLGLTYVEPGLCTLLLVQTLCASLSAALVGWSEACRRWQVVIYAANFIVTAAILVPVARVFVVMLTPAVLWLMILPIALLVLSSIPLLLCITPHKARSYLTASAAVLGIAGVLIIAVMDNATADRPREVNIYRIQDSDHGKAWVATGHEGYRLSVSLAHAVRFSPNPQTPWPSELFGPKYVVQVSPTNERAPHMRACHTDNQVTAAVVLCSEWNQLSFDSVVIVIPKGTDISTFTLAGSRFQLPSSMVVRGGVIKIRGAETTQAPFSVILADGKLPQDMLLVGERDVLPAEARRIADHRSNSEVPKNDGDVSFVFTKHPWL